MSLKINNDKIKEIDKENLIKLCPFNAIEDKNSQIFINSNCKMCMICVKNSEGKIEYVKEQIKKIDKTQYKDIVVYVEHANLVIHPVVLELLEKARELSNKINQRVCVIIIGDNNNKICSNLQNYPIDIIYSYDFKELEKFKVDIYANCLNDFIKLYKPSSILFGSTNIGRLLAPTIAAKCKTGLTADCTILDIKENTDLIQIRPAFGGNIMAQIITKNSRPQICTVRHKIFNSIKQLKNNDLKIINCNIEKNKLISKINILESKIKEISESISDAEIIVAIGRGVKSKKDIEIFNKFSKTLNATIAGTRPIIEAGWLDVKKQIGLSGRTVKPKLIICCGISGSVQFTAGMNNSDKIIAINNDENAAIFNIAHVKIVGDIYKIIPEFVILGKG